MNNRLVNICPDSHKNLLKLFQIFQVLIIDIYPEEKFKENTELMSSRQ